MKVCILGNNLTALTLAKALVNQNIKVDALYHKNILNFSQSRTIGISKSNIDYFNENIINIDQILWKLKRIEIYSETLNKDKLANFEKDNDQLFSIVKSHELYQILKKNLFKSNYFRLKFLDNKNLSFINNYELIVNCDPHNVVTKKFFSKKMVKQYNSNAYTTIIKHETILNDTAIQIFTTKGPLAFLPISNEETSIVYSVHNSINQKKENIEQLIKDKNFKYKIKNIEKIDEFKLKFLNLRSYYHDNILAFGDILHKIHPLAGQGFNMTIRDIKILSNIIKNKLELGLSLDSSVNIEFENVTKHKNFIFSNGVDLIHEFFNVERKMNLNVLSKSVQLINKYPVINKLFMRIADRGIFL